MSMRDVQFGTQRQVWTITRTVPPRRRHARSWSSAQTCCSTATREPDGFARVPEYQDEESRASVLPGLRSRYGSHALALGARPGRGTGAESVDTSPLVAGFGRSESVDTLPEMAGFDMRGSVDTSGEIAGFGFDSLGRPRLRTGMPAALR
jgi:hypothetical protein